MHDPRSIVITGASSGIGAALAQAYAGPGIALALLGRNTDRLEQTAAACRSAGASVITAPLDVTDADAMRDWLLERDRTDPIDLIIANAGISGGTGGDGEGEAQARRIFAVNIDGVLNTVLPLLPAMTGRGRGQIALMSSLAGFMGFPGAPAYSASKAAVKAYGEALRGSVHGRGVGVSVICPGFVTSPMTAANDYAMPFLMPADKAAAIIKGGLARNRARIAFPWPMLALVRFAAILPAALVDRMTRRLPEKK